MNIYDEPFETFQDHVTLYFNEQKLTALKVYLAQNDTTLEVELNKFIEKLYNDVVPESICEYLEKVEEYNSIVRSKQITKPFDPFWDSDSAEPVDQVEPIGTEDWKWD